MRGGVGKVLQALADFLVDERCLSCARRAADYDHLAPPRAPASAALALPVRTPMRIETRPLCGACCHRLTAVHDPVVIGTRCADGSMALVSGGRVPPVAATTDAPTVALAVWPAFETDDRVLAVVHALKFARWERLARWFAFALAAGLPSRALDDRAPVLVPVPMDRASLRRRGFNQAERVAKALSACTGVEVAPHALVKTRRTAPQSSLGAVARARNVAGAIAVGQHAAFAGRIVILVDDLVTTGATAAACAVAAWGAGARDVRVVSIGFRP